MRLIQAEAAMNAGDYAAFATAINHIRALNGMADIVAPTEVGTLVFPMDIANTTSAAQVLDRERYATLWLEGRRLFDLDRWDHPFLDGNWIVGGAAIPSRLSCMPIPKIECQLNPNLEDDANGVCSG
jgi:hypothetical protein